MIKNIKLKFGRAPDLEQTTVNALPITVFVGPNNSGKSQILREVHQFCISGNQNTNNKIIDNIELKAVSEDDVNNVIDKIKQEPTFGEMIHQDHILIGKNGEKQQVHLPSLKVALVNPSTSLYQFCNSYLKYSTLILNGSNRINLVNMQGAGDLQAPPYTSFQVLFRDNAKRHEVRRIIYEAFGQYLVIDPTNLGHLSLRLSSKEPENEVEERGIHEAAVNFHKNAMPIDYASDGVKVDCSQYPRHETASF